MLLKIENTENTDIEITKRVVTKLSSTEHNKV